MGARFVRFLISLRRIVVSIICTFKTVIWALVLLLLIIYSFSIFFAHGYHLHKKMKAEQYEDVNPDLVLYWGSLLDAMFTLYKTVAGGLSWHDASYALRDMGVFWVVVFTVYTVFVNIAVMNVITGIFCESAIESAQADQENVVQQQIQQRERYVKSLTDLFNNIDLDGSGTVSKEEFIGHLDDEEAKAVFEFMGIQVNDAREVISIIDQTDSGNIDLDEFVIGCLRLRGYARAIDVVQVQYENSILMSMMHDVTGLVLDLKTALLSGKKSRKTASTSNQVHLKNFI